METGGEAPLLFISHGQHYQYNEHRLYDTSQNRCYSIDTPTLTEKRILGSTYGWLVINDMSTYECWIWNPVSGEMIRLPRLNGIIAYTTCVLSKVPTESTCHILFNSVWGVDLAFCQIGDNEFVDISTEDIEDVKCLNTMASFDGNIYALVWYDTLVTIQFVGKTIEFQPILKLGQPWQISLPLQPWSTHERYYLIESYDGDLLLVCEMHSTRYRAYYSDFKVFQIDIDEMEYVELVDIGERAIFLSTAGQAFCCSTNCTGIKPNSIYYTLGDSERGNVFVYNLNNRSTTRLLPCPAVERGMSLSYWIESSSMMLFTNV